MYLKIMIARSFHLKTLFTGIWILEVRMSTIRENDISPKLKKHIFFSHPTQRHALFDPIFKQCVHSDHIAQVLVPTTTCFNLLGLSLFGVQCQMALDLNNTERCFHESAIQWHNIKVNFNSSIIYLHTKPTNLPLIFEQ